ncbi:luciferase family protein [Streptomyces sp. NPDC058108]|uniref:luciferase domain-containing protein n=1 Tax=Streptomyces sp. NPDC058108 TaxID=3346344 RepID=UPI0036E9F350
MNGAKLAMERLATWPDLHGATPACAAGPALCSAGAEIVHFHGDSDAELHLTAAAIERLRPELGRSTAIRLHPASAWVTVHLNCEDDIALLTSLVSVALRAHTAAWPRPAAQPCSLHPAPPTHRRAARHLPSVARSGRRRDRRESSDVQTGS